MLADDKGGDYVGRVESYGAVALPYAAIHPTSERLSEKRGRSLHSSTTDHTKALFAFRISAISTLLALLVHLFGQSQKGNSRKFA